MENAKPSLSAVGVIQPEPKNGNSPLTPSIDNQQQPSPSSSQQRAKSSVMNAFKDISPAPKNPSMDQSSSCKSPPHMVGQTMAKAHSSSRDRVVSLLTEFQSLAPPFGSPHQQALQQQALHQQALHQQALKQHGIQSVGFQSPLQPSRQIQGNQNSQQKQSVCLQNEDLCEPTDGREFSHLDRTRGRGHQVIEINDRKGQEEKDCMKEHELSRRHGEADQNLTVQSQSSARTGAREAVLADLNVEPPVSDADEPERSGGGKVAAQPECSRSTNDQKRKQKTPTKVRNVVKDSEEDCKKFVKPGKARPKLKGDSTLESGQDTDADQQYLGVSASREEKIKSLKAGLVHVARKMPRNAHAHFVLGLMYQRLVQPLKAVTAFEKSVEILKQSEEEMGQSRPELLSLVQIHHAQCLLQGSIGDNCTTSDELQKEEIDSIVCKLRESLQADDRQASVWNTLGLLLLRTGRVQSAISVLSSLISVTPDYLDALANLGVAYLHSGDLEYAGRCFQELLGKDRNHPGALINYGALLLRQYGSLVAGVGARGYPEAYATQLAVACAAQQCLAAAIKGDPKAGHVWVNLAAAYSLAGDHLSAGRCLEQASKLEPMRMSIRYAIAAHRVKDAERSLDPKQQLSWAANEMASILREGDPATVQPRLAWAGLAMVDRAQHETAAAFEEGESDLKEVKERAFYTLQQAIEEDPDDAVQWHQLGLHTLCTLQFKAAQSYLKTAIVRRKSCSFAWSNLGIALQLSEDPSLAEDVYKQAVSLAPCEQAHSMLSNLGNLYRQQKRFGDASQVFAKALEICPGYAPACNNLGLLHIVEGQWEDAIACFNRALIADPLLDAAKSNKMKALALSGICTDGNSPMSPTIVYSPETPLDLPTFSVVLADAVQIIPSVPIQESPVFFHESPEHENGG